MGNFITADRETDYLFPPSMQDWLPEDHLARFVVELLIYGYATGVFSILIYRFQCGMG